MVNPFEKTQKEKVPVIKPLIPWELEESHPEVVWRTKVDDRYLVEVRGVSRSKGELLIFDHKNNDEKIAGWDVALSYGAVFGPDVADVKDWEEKVLDFIDNKYDKK